MTLLNSAVSHLNRFYAIACCLFNIALTLILPFTRVYNYSWRIGLNNYYSQFLVYITIELKTADK